MMDVSWMLFATLGSWLWLVQIGFTISTQRRLEEAHKREGEYGSMLDSLRNERRRLMTQKEPSDASNS